MLPSHFVLSSLSSLRDTLNLMCLSIELTDLVVWLYPIQSDKYKENLQLISVSPLAGKINWKTSG
ncbi:MAG: hypothetical protein K0S39_175 [Paenibacillus sp.]|nr:hypothetical protein [Paenibacillus sp.]